MFWWSRKIFEAPLLTRQSKNLTRALQKQALTCHLTKPDRSLSVLEIKKILVKVPKRDRKWATLGKEKRNSSKNSYHFGSLWVEVACDEHLWQARMGGHPSNCSTCFKWALQVALSVSVWACNDVDALRMPFFMQAWFRHCHPFDLWITKARVLKCNHANYTKVIFLKLWRFGIRGIHNRVIFHDSQSLTVLGKPPWVSPHGR
jgi:hypothetical protein